MEVSAAVYPTGSGLRPVQTDIEFTRDAWDTIHDEVERARRVFTSKRHSGFAIHGRMVWSAHRHESARPAGHPEHLAGPKSLFQPARRMDGTPRGRHLLRRGRRSTLVAV